MQIKFRKLLQNVFGVNSKFAIFEKILVVLFILCFNLSLFRPLRKRARLGR